MKTLNFISFPHLKTLIGLIILIFLFGQCSSPNQDAKTESDSQSPTISTMLYKLYVVKTKAAASESHGVEFFSEFNEIYVENNVKVIGVWLNSDDPYEIYLMTAFKDAAHYTSFVEKMKSNEKYQEMSRAMETERDSVRAINLKMAVPL